MIIHERKNKPGRPPYNLEWPDGEFTAKQLAEELRGSISRVSIHTKIKRALYADEPALKIVGQIKPKIGRPETVYSTVNKNETETQLGSVCSRNS